MPRKLSLNQGLVFIFVSFIIKTISSSDTTFVKVNTNITEVPSHEILPTHKRLRIRHNKITEVQATDFAGMAELSEIDLEGNLITDVHKDAFKDNIKLTSISFKSNLLQFLHPDTFIHNHRLAKINMIHNKMRASLYVGRNRKLWQLSLRDNQITYIPGNAFINTSLRSSILMGNPVRGINDSVLFGTQENLYIDFGWGRVTRFPNFAAYAPTVRVIRFMHNLIDYIPGEFILGLNRLELVRMENNYLHTIPDLVHFQGLSQLQFFGVQNNPFTMWKSRFLLDQVWILEFYHHSHILTTQTQRSPVSWSIGRSGWVAMERPYHWSPWVLEG